MIILNILNLFLEIYSLLIPMHLHFQIEFSPAPEYLLQYFFFGVIINNLFMSTHMHTYLCAHSHVFF